MSVASKTAQNITNVIETSMREEQDNPVGEYDWRPQLCPVCELPPTKLIGFRGGAAHRQTLGVRCAIWRCQRCALIFPDPMPVPLRGLDQHYAMAPEVFFQKHDPASKEQGSASILRSAEKLSGGKGRLLDIGAGRGEQLRAALQDGWSAIGIETSSAFAEYASSFSGAEIRREALERCNFPSGEFDVVILAAVLEHLYDPDQTIKEIARILRPGGALYVDVPNEDGLYFRAGNLYQKLRRRDWVVNLSPTFSPFHLFGFTGRSLRALLNKHGLEPAVWRYYEGVNLAPDAGGAAGFAERLAARIVTRLSKVGSLGNYMETWAVKQ